VVGAGEADAWVVGEEIAALGRGWTGLTVHVGGGGIGRRRWLHFKGGDGGQ
jgi:hypothetical protein